VTRASEAFALEIIEQPGWNRVIRFAATVAASVANWGGGPMNPGGRRVVIVE